MPPRNTNPHLPQDFVAQALEEIHRIDPNVNTGPGTVVRTLIENVARSATSPALPSYGSNLGASLGLQADYEQIERRLLAGMGLTPDDLRRAAASPTGRNPPLRGRTHQVAMIDDLAHFQERLQPLTRADLQRARQELERMGTPSSRMILDEQTFLDLVGLSSEPPAATHGNYAAQVENARRQIQEQEDRTILEMLEQQTRREQTYRQEFMGEFLTDPPYAEPGWQMHELPGTVAVNPRAAERVHMPLFELHSNPTIRIDDIRERRFNMTGSTNPCGEIPLGEPMSLEQMERVALVVRRTAWQRIMAVEEELDFPV